MDKKTNFYTDLKIGEIENLFWNNGSRDVPGKLVDEELLNKTVRVKINWNGRVSGTLKLKGIWNYAKYQDSYYFLDIVAPLDNNKQLFTYAIYRDEWAEFIKSKNVIKGTLIKTNIEKILWENLQTTSAVISNLGKTTHISLLTESDQNQGVKKIIPPPSWAEKKVWVVTREKFNFWFKSVKNADVKQWNPKPLWTMSVENKDWVTFNCFLEMTEIDHWAHELHGLLNTWVEENKGCLNVCLVNNGEAMGINGWINQHKEENQIENVYCIEPCWGTGLLSNTAEENNFITEVDLSGLIDIQPISKKAYGTETSTRSVLKFFTGESSNVDNSTKIGTLLNPKDTREIFTNTFPKGKDKIFELNYYSILDTRYFLKEDTFTNYPITHIPERTTSRWDSPQLSFKVGLFKFTSKNSSSIIAFTLKKYTTFQTQDFQMAVGDFYLHFNTTEEARKYKGMALVFRTNQDANPVNNEDIAVNKATLVFVENNTFTLPLVETALKNNINPHVSEAEMDACAYVSQYGEPKERFCSSAREGETWDEYASRRRKVFEFEPDTFKVSGVVSGEVDTDDYDLAGTHDLTTYQPVEGITEVIRDYWTFSPTFTNSGTGKIKSKQFSDLPSWAKQDLPQWVQWLSGTFTYGPWKWEHNQRATVKAEFKNVVAHTTAHRPWTWPKDEKTGDWIYLIASHSSDKSHIYLYTDDFLNQYKFTLSGLQYAQNYSNPIKKIWDSLPRAKPKSKPTKYMTWDENDKGATWNKNKWVFDLLGTSTKNQNAYLGDHRNDYQNYTQEDFVNGLDKIIAELYIRFSPQLKPSWDEQEQGYFIIWPTRGDYQTNCQLFDLVGTNYIMCIQQKLNTISPKISLIVKDNDVIEYVAGQDLIINERPPIKDIIKAINQNNIFFLHGHTFEIKTKFTFDPSHEVKWTLTLGSFDLPVEGINEYYHYQFVGPLEYIDNQFNISKATKSVAGNNVDMSRLLLERDQFNDQRKMDLSNIDNNNRNNRTALMAAYEDYTLGRDAANTQWGTSLAMGLLSAPAAAISGTMSGMGTGAALGAGGAIAGPVMGAIGAVGAVAGTIASAVQGAQQMAMDNYKGARDLAEREAQQAKQLELTKNQSDQTHKYAEIRMRRELDRMTSHRIAANINDRVVLDAYLAQAGKSRYHLIHSTPSDVIMPYLNAFFKEYGADLLVNDYVFSSDFSKAEDETMILQFSSVYNLKIKDVILLRNLQGRLVNGIKII